MFQVRRKLSHRLFIALILIAVLPVCTIGYYSYRAAQNALTQTAFLHISTIALDHANHLESWLRERLDDVRVLSELPTVRDLCQHYCSTRTYEMPSPDHARLLTSIAALTQGRSPSYESIHILTLSGDILASTDPSSKDVAHFRDLPVFKQLRNSDEAVIGDVHEEGEHQRKMHLLARVQVPGHPPIAYVLAVLDVSKTIDPIMTDRVGLGKTGEVYLVNSGGVIVSKAKYVSRNDAFDHRYDTYAIKAALTHASGTAVYKNYAGQEVVGSYLWLPKFDWALIAEMRRDEIMRPLEWIKMTVILAVGAVSLLCFLLAYFVSQRVSRPITRMAEAAGNIAEGDLDQRIPYSGKDEIGVLAASFNIMTQRLSSLLSSLQQKEVSLQQAYDDLVATQEQLVRSEKMAAIGELVASVVHEMRNPLSSIKLNLQIIGRSIEGEGVLAEHYRIALDQAMQLEKMFSDLLNYSKPLSLQRVPVNLASLIEKSLMQLKSELLVNEVRVKKNFYTDIPEISADPDKIAQVLVNVIKNGVEAGGKGGAVEIEARCHEWNGREYVEVAVADDGPGISEQHLKRVFQPFFTTKKKGTGLGLSIVRKIMDAHGGRIILSSRNGRGTLALLYFPSSRKVDEKDTGRG